MKRLSLAALALAILITATAASGWVPIYYTRYQPLVAMHAGTSWTYAGSALEQTHTGDVRIPLHLEQGEIVGSVGVMWRGGPGHTVDPVGNGIITPTVAVYRVDRMGGETWLCAQKDPDGVSPADYEQPHAIVASCSFTVDLTSGIYVLRLLPENTDGWYTGSTPDYQPGGLLLSAWVGVR
jgi:hypothetical protein